MKKIKIAVDIDDVLSEFAPAFVDFSNKKWGTNLTIDDFTEDYAKMWQIDHKSIKDRFYHIKTSIFSNLVPIDNSYEVLKYLSKKYDLTLLTSRSRDTYDLCVDWIDKNFEGIFDKVNMSGIWDDSKDHKNAHLGTKAEKFTEIDADYLIDDQIKHCMAVAESGGKAIVFGDYPWNKGELPESVARCKNWHEVRLFFEKV